MTDRDSRIESAAKVIADRYGHEPDEYLPDARALDDAGLLADPDALTRAQRSALHDYADALAANESAETWQKSDFVSDVRDWADDDLLADPADRDELASFADAVAKVTPCTCSAQRSRAERAEAEAAELREKWLAFTSRLGFGDIKTEPAAELAAMVDPIEQAFSDASDHVECAVICELCGERLADKVCDECHGSGCLPNPALAYLECGTCAGAGKVHEGCVEKSYADLATEAAELRAQVGRVRALADRYAAHEAAGIVGYAGLADDLRDVLDPEGGGRG